MKILHAITLAELGGAQSVVINLCNKAVEDGHEVWVASGSEVEMWELLDSKVHPIRLRNIQRAIHPLKDIKTWWELRQIHQQVQPDVVHLHSSKMGVLGRLAFPSNKIIYTVHGFDSIRVAFRKFLVFEKRLQYSAKAIVAVSRYDENNLKAEGIKERVKLIYNGIKDSTAEPLPVEYSSIINQLKAIRKERKIVMCIARLAPPKNFNLFLEIAEKFQDQSVDFIWIGNKAPVTQSLPSNVQLLGEVKNAQALLSFADAFILPSDYEGLPISVLEALAYGVPVIASAVGGIPEVLDGDNGFAVPNSVQDFERALHRILFQNERDYSWHARKSFEDHFTIQKMYKKYIDLYQL